jgi:hypothetical protein
LAQCPIYRKACPSLFTFSFLFLAWSVASIGLEVSADRVDREKLWEIIN